MPIPNNLEPLNPETRLYPASWRDAAIRASYDSARGGVTCPICKITFRGLAGLRLLHADHIMSWSAGGLTTWENLQILCSPCNIMKSGN
ncbi:MAG TPA: HNH endonuclease signature motif containing protein [Verrucomicrobiae bacterium]|nr:HNH endonuclease signature motif containing protein [Verrucomicrobiae bacterium]